jgi:hypothetical protein
MRVEGDVELLRAAAPPLRRYGAAGQRVRSRAREAGS